MADGKYDGSSGNDTINRSSVDGGGDQVDGSDGLNDSIYGYGGNDSIEAGRGNDTVFGGAGTDSIDGASGDDLLDGGSGDDALYGGSGWDTFQSGAGNDTYYGGTGIDYIDFGNETGGVSIDFGANTIGGAAAGDVMGGGVDGAIGSDYDDTIVGYDAFSGSGDVYTNVFFGGGGNDILDGRGGPDYMDGGSGDDTFMMTGSFGDDTIYGVEGGSDNDVLDFSSQSTPLNLSYSAPEAGTVTMGGSTVTFAQIERVNATSGNDTVTGSSGGDTIYAMAGNDTVMAGGGNDSVVGGAGSDTIYGEAGNDSLTGDTGDDFLYGGTGNDVLSGGRGNDSIRGGSGDDTLLGGSGEDSIYGDAGNDLIFAGAGNETVFGGTGNDTINAQAGADTVYGGQGNDSITAASGDDTIYGESGDDTVVLTQPGNYMLYGGEDPGDTDYDVLDISSLGAGGQVSAITYNSGDDESGTITFTNGDVATFSGFEHIICLARGTRILTDRGYRRIENLRRGDMIQTKDKGLQPLRWIGSRDVPAIGPSAPVVFAPGAIGNDRVLRVSPQHRMLISGWKPDVLFGEPEVLVAAKHLIDGHEVTQSHGGEVEYFHLCLDRHHIIYAEGAPTESFLPGKIGLDTLTTRQRADLARALPQLGQPGVDAPVRPMLRAYEAKLLSDPLSTCGAYLPPRTFGAVDGPR